jgi:hypothetical protein
MIVTKIQGGLGNQLFQWAVTKNLSIKHNTDYYFDLSHIGKSNFDVSSRGLELDKFDSIKVNSYANNSQLITVSDNFIYKEINDNSYLDGYWQSEKYFKENEDIIRRDLEIPKNLESRLYSKYPFLTESTLCIHVRRGDYLQLPNHHPTQSVDYYTQGYDLINDDNINVVIFSDDIVWCKDNFKFNNTHFIENEGNISDLYMMSLCDHNIISNSTFSWWGAWLNKSVNKKVICPSVWFGELIKLPTDDIYCNNWIKI